MVQPPLNQEQSNFSDRKTYSERTIIYIYCSEKWTSYVPKIFSQQFFPNLQVECKEIYLLSCKVSIDTNLHMFQYKILNKILYLNKQLFIFNKKGTKLCSHCRWQDETTNHIFVECTFAKKLRSDLRHYCQCSFDLPILNSQSATFGFFEIDPDLVILLNHTLLLYKCYIYSSRGSWNIFKKLLIWKKKYRQEMKKNN